MNLQKDPFQSVCDALIVALKNQIPQLKSIAAGWPAAKWFTVDKNLPAVRFLQVSEIGKNVTSRLNVHKTTVNSDGKTGYIYTEQKRLFFLLQISLFANTPQDRASMGWTIKQYLTTNYRLNLDDGEYAMLKEKGDHQSIKSETNCYQRDLTFEVTARVLDATPANKVTLIKDNTEIK